MSVHLYIFTWVIILKRIVLGFINFNEKHSPQTLFTTNSRMRLLEYPLDITSVQFSFDLINNWSKQYISDSYINYLKIYNDHKTLYTRKRHHVGYVLNTELIIIMFKIGNSQNSTNVAHNNLFIIMYMFAEAILL